MKAEMVQIELKYRSRAGNLKKSSLGRARGDNFVRNALLSDAEREHPDVSPTALTKLIDYILKTTR